MSEARRAADAARTGRPCAICRRPAVRRYTPFCSRRCADIDLGRWLKGVYRVPTSEQPAEAEADAGGERAGPAPPK